MTGKLNDDGLGSKTYQLSRAVGPVVHVRPPPSPGYTAELGIGRGEAAFDGTQSCPPLADVVEQSGSDEVASEGLTHGHVPGRLETVALVILWLGEEDPALNW